MKHHETLSPSSFPALSQCPHFISKKRETRESQRGTKIHHYLAGLLKENTVGAFLSEDIEVVARAEWSANKLRELIGKDGQIHGIEEKVTISDGFDEVTFGWLDAWGVSDNDGKGALFIADAKSGEYRNYKEQFACYALGLMDKTHMDSCRIIVLYCDVDGGAADGKGTWHDYTLTLLEAETIVFNTVEHVRDKAKYPQQENEYCAWCKLKSTCPVWVQPAMKALALAPTKEVNGLAPYIHNLELLKNDPVKLGVAIEQWRKLEKLWEDVGLESFAKTALEAGQEVPGWSVTHVQGREQYSEEDVEMLLCSAVRDMGTQRARRFITIKPKEFAIAWQEYSKEPLPIQPARGNGFTKLVKAK